jgi:two-component system nitrate/nitrite response regulator NarL
VAGGGTAFAPEVQSGLASELHERERGQQGPLLTSREREVLKLVAAGHSAPEIAERIHLSPATVKSHLQAIYDKLGVAERAAAVAEGMRRGLLE